MDKSEFRIFLFHHLKLPHPLIKKGGGRGPLLYVVTGKFHFLTTFTRCVLIQIHSKFFVL